MQGLSAVTEQERPVHLEIEHAAHLYQTSRSQLCKLVAEGQVPAVRVGRSLRLRRSDLEAFFAAHTTR
ncbi:MAG: helix-turn-helix domain-containing protein [Thermomicrobiales bacterium]